MWIYTDYPWKMHVAKNHMSEKKKKNTKNPKVLQAMTLDLFVQPFVTLNIGGHTMDSSFVTLIFPFSLFFGVWKIIWSKGIGGSTLIHGYSTNPPLTYPPPRNKGLIRPY